MDLVYITHEIEKSLIDFYNITGFRIALFDKNFHEIIAYPTRLSSFCKIVRSDATLYSRCKLQDYEGFSNCKKSKDTVKYQCHLGLTEIITPIQSDGNIIGYIMTGQIYGSDSKFKDWNDIDEFMKNYNIDIPTLRNAYDDMNVVLEDKILSMSNIAKLLTYYLYNSGKISTNVNSLSYKINDYIIKNLKNPIDVNILCDYFNYQKTTFYKLTNDFFGVGIMKHVKNLRIQTAKELLSSTDLPISDIAYEVGFNDYNYFTKVFKQEVKCTPREFRKNNISIV